MALLDLSLVTRALVRLLEQHVGSSDGWSGSVTLNVSPRAPDALDGDHTLGLYLFHVSEDPAYRNTPISGADTPAVRYAPMALNLHYQLTAHSDILGADGAYQEQLMFGLGLKAFHDYPLLTDETTINGTAIFPAELLGGGDHLRITMDQLDAETARSYWTSDADPVRLSAYYQVSVVRLEPEEIQRRAGRVLLPGVQVFTTGSPRLDGSTSTHLITLPGDPDPSEIVVRPAQVPVGGGVTFTGSALAGDSVTLLLRNARFDPPVAADGAWNTVATASGISVDVQETASGQDVLPGIYAAIARVAVDREMPDGSTRTFEFRSNETPFQILPRIDAVSAPNASGEFTISGYVFQHADLAAVDVAVYVQGDSLTPGTGGALAQGEFAITAANTLEVRLPAGLTSGDEVPVRVYVSGAESLPQWVQVP